MFIWRQINFETNLKLRKTTTPVPFFVEARTKKKNPSKPKCYTLTFFQTPTPKKEKQKPVRNPREFFLVGPLQKKKKTSPRDLP
jgi:hypothetical protein